MIWGCRFVQCVPARTSPVAVPVAVHSWSATRARYEIFDLGQGTTVVGVVVGRVCLDLEDLIFGRHSISWDGLLLLALPDSESMSRHAAEGMRI
jgi:hypothetical protein